MNDLVLGRSNYCEERSCECLIVFPEVRGRRRVEDLMEGRSSYCEGVKGGVAASSGICT